MKRSVLIFCFAMLVTMSITALVNADEGTGEQSGNVIQIEGSIKHFSYQGGFYGIEGDDGKTYKPVDMTSNFKVEGVRVKVTAKPIEKEFLLPGWGIPIKILKIERE